MKKCDCCKEEKDCNINVAISGKTMNFCGMACYYRWIKEQEEKNNENSEDGR